MGVSLKTQNQYQKYPSPAPKKETPKKIKNHKKKTQKRYAAGGPPGRSPAYFCVLFFGFLFFVGSLFLGGGEGIFGIVFVFLGTPHPVSYEPPWAAP